MAVTLTAYGMYLAARVTKCAVDIGVRKMCSFVVLKSRFCSEKFGENKSDFHFGKNGHSDARFSLEICSFVEWNGKRLENVIMVSWFFSAFCISLSVKTEENRKKIKTIVQCSRSSSQRGDNNFQLMTISF